VKLDQTTVLGLGELETAPGFLLQIALVTHVEAVSALLSEGTPLRMSEYAILVAINENPGALQGEIGDLLHISHPHMTKVISQLETAGYVVRTVPRENRRSLQLDLTDAGRAVLSDMRRIVPPAASQALDMLSDSEKDALVELLRKIARRPDRATNEQRKFS